MKSLRRITRVACGAALFTSLAAPAATVWKADSSGNWNGNWSDEAHWSGEVPTATLDARLPQGTYTVTLTEDAETAQLYVGKNEETNRGVVTLAGAGKTLRVGGSYVTVCSNAAFTVVGPTLSASQFVRVYGGGRLTIPSEGTLAVTSGIYLDGGALALSGGTVTANELTLEDAADFTMTGGTFDLASKTPALSDEATFAITGGTFFQRGTKNTSKIADPRVLPRGGKYVVSYAGNPSVTLTAEENAEATLGGSLYVTNAASSWFYLPQTMTLAGGGALYAGYFNFPQGKLTDVRLATLALGSALYPSSSSYDETVLDLLGPTTLAAWGDWTTGGRKCTINLNGVITVATADCFDPTRTHAVTFDNLAPKALSTLAITGGGSATCRFRDYWYHLESLSVAAGTTLTLKDVLSRAILLKDLALSENATVNVAYPAYVEVSRAVTAASGATLVATLPDSPVAGTNYPILLVYPGVALPDVTVTIANPASGWRILRTATGIWLTDDTVVAASEAMEWTGAASGSWNDAGNWQGGAVPNDATAVATISGKACGAIDVNLGEEQLNVLSLVFKNSMPTVLSGSTIAFSQTGSGASAAFVAKGDFPVVIGNTLKALGKGANLGVSAEGNSYICLAGTSAVAGKFCFDGDVRVSGSVTCGDLSHLAAQSGGRTSILRVLEGGSVTVTGAYSENTKSSALEIEGGATLTFQSAGKCRYYSNAFEHEVNGRLSIEAPLLLGVVGTYDGTGRVDVATTRSYTRGTGSMRLKGGITVVPREWNTVTSDSVGNAINLVIAGKATLGAAGDWRYGVASGVEPTALTSARQISLERPLAELTFDTGDVADASVGRTVTIEEPIVGPGSLVKKGLGTLKLASAENAIGGGVRVSDGTLACAADQAFTSLTLAAGAGLQIGTSAESRPVLVTANSDVNLTGVSVKMEGLTADDDCFASWRTVFATVGGHTITGTPNESETFRWRIVQTPDGAVLQAKKRAGIILLVR